MTTHISRWLVRFLFCVAATNAFALQVSLTSGTNFYTDFGHSMQGDHVSLMIKNTDGVTYSNVWVTLGSFTNTSMSLGGGDPGRFRLGALTNNQSSAAFFYLIATNDPTHGSYNNRFTVSVYNGYPTAGGTLLTTSNFMENVQDTTQANANKVTVITSTTNPIVGGVSKISVFGSTGTVGGPGSAFTAAV